MKSLYVYNNNRWVAVVGNGSGSADLSAYATTAFVAQSLTPLDSTLTQVGQAVTLLEMKWDTYESWKQTVETFAEDIEVRVAALEGADFTQYAKLTDPEQAISARRVEVTGVNLRKFPEAGSPAVCSILYSDVGGGARVGVSVNNAAPKPFAYAEELAAYAKQTDSGQVVTAKAVIAESFAFDPTHAIKYVDDGQGFGQRLAFVYVESGEVVTDQITLRSDIAPVIADLTAQIAAIAGGGGTVDLSAYAKLSDANQNITALEVTARSFAFSETNVLALHDNNDGNGMRPTYFWDEFGSIRSEPLVVRSDLWFYLMPLETQVGFLQQSVDALQVAVGGGPVDLSPYARITDTNQILTSKSYIGEAFAFDQSHVLKMHDTGEGFGARLSFVWMESGDARVEPIALRSDIAPVIDDIESRLSSAESSVASLLPGPWVSVPLKSDIIPEAGKFARMRLLPGDMVQIIGEIKRQDGQNFAVDQYNAISVAFPAAYRPSKNTSWTAPTYGGDPTGSHANVLVNSSGIMSVNPKLTSPTKVELSGIYYKGAWPG